MTKLPIYALEAVPATLASTVFEKLRLDILEGVMAPGEKLKIDSLCERYDVGASPMREALNRLAAAHLVELSDQRGFRVPGVSRAELEELSRTRCWVNEIAVREAVKHGDSAWEEEVVLTFHRLRRIPSGLPDGHLNREWEIQHRRFHAAIIAACRSKWMLQFHEMLFDYADRHRHLYARLSAERNDPITEHRLIMEAVVERDAERAVHLLNAGVLAMQQSCIEAWDGSEQLSK